VVLDRIVSETQIYDAWADEDWINDGAAVNVSLICIGNGNPTVRLNGKSVMLVHADLTARTDSGGVDLTKARKLPENRQTCYYATVKAGQTPTWYGHGRMPWRSRVAHLTHGL
jgi:hypothetical protein